MFSLTITHIDNRHLYDNDNDNGQDDDDDDTNIDEDNAYFSQSVCILFFASSKLTPCTKWFICTFSHKMLFYTACASIIVVHSSPNSPMNKKKSYKIEMKQKQCHLDLEIIAIAIFVCHKQPFGPLI